MFVQHSAVVIAEHKSSEVQSVNSIKGKSYIKCEFLVTSSPMSFN